MNIIFILDDDEDILFALSRWLVRVGYKVYVFTCSKDLMQFFDTCLPDLMLFDINLKGEDGREVCKTMRRDFKYNKPILHFSAINNVPEDSLYPCASGFIAKPFELDELTRVLDSYLADSTTPHT